MTHHLSTKPIIGAAITTFNEFDHLQRCLQSGKEQWDIAVVVDNSNDGATSKGIYQFENVIRIQGHPDNWWSAGTNIAIRKCLELECDYVFLVNADVTLSPDSLSQLLSAMTDRAIVASAVLDADKRDTVYWAGGSWRRVSNIIPVVLNRPLYQHQPVSALPDIPYPVEDVHGRGVLYPASVFRECGFYDEKTFPHYGADMDFCFRVRDAGYRLFVNPRARVFVDTRRGFLSEKKDETILNRLQHLWSFIYDRDDRIGFRMLWKFYRRHFPPHEAIATFLFSTANRTRKTFFKSL